ncbi:MAG: DUF2066 domain-containing protein [Xanthomonadales bacterium]|nr:DUF2066 domain-containing protein [Xanthomonadales bacterium]
MIRFFPSLLPLMPLLLWLLALPFSAVYALEVDVYAGKAPVADQGPDERDRAMPLALLNALEKHSGVRDFSAVPELEQALAVAPSIVVSYYYDLVELPRADGGLEQDLRLSASFVGSRVDELARELQLPLWRADRRVIEMWVVVDNGFQREIMPLELGYLEARLDDVARRRGQPLAWPRPDEDGMYPVDTQLLWGGYTEDLAGAKGTGVMILAAQRQGPRWDVRANLGFGEENWGWRLDGFDLEAVLVNGLQQAIDQVAAANSIGAAGLSSSDFKLTVEGVNTTREYQELLAYLQRLALVERVDVIAARSDGITFQLRLNALPNYLLDVFDHDGVIENTRQDGRYVLAGEDELR